MKPIEPAELSAYLDGELTGERAAEVQAALAGDGALRRTFEELARMDAAWKVAADKAAFKPAATLPQKTTWMESPLIVAAATILLVGLRVAPKLSDLIVWGLALHAVGLAIALFWVVRIARTSDSE